jgi:parallel beta-helix repeat protein
MRKAQMFIVTIVFLAGVISAVQVSLFVYSGMDVSETIVSNDAFIYKNIKGIVNETVTSSASCTEARDSLNELRSFLNNREVQSIEHVIDIDFMSECGNWNNLYPADPPIRMYVDVVSGAGSLQMTTKSELLIYRTGIVEEDTEPSFYCDDCASCNTVIANSNAGNIIYLNDSIENQIGDCIDFDGKDGITFDCQGFTISGDGDTNGVGILLEEGGGGSNSNTIRDCPNISYFSRGIDVEASDDNILINITSNYNYRHGISISGARNTFSNITTSYTTRYGMSVRGGSDNTLTGITANYNGREGIRIWNSTRTIITDATTNSNNRYGIRICRDSDFSIITGSRIENNILAGIHFDTEGCACQENNLIYNNYLNNDQNVLIGPGTPSSNYFNTTLDCSSGPNMIGGSCIGGNYWTDSDGNYSDTCDDLLAPSGICDDPYEINTTLTWARDYFPLTEMPATFECDSCANCNSVITSAGSRDTVTLTQDIDNHIGNCIDYDGSDWITFDCQGFTISGDGDMNGQGIWLSDIGDGSNNNTIRNCPNISYFERGIFLQSSSNNTINSVTSSDNTRTGIYLHSSSSNRIINAITSDNTQYGVRLAVSSTNNLISGVTVIGNSQWNIWIDSSDNNNLSNVITSDGPIGIYLTSSINTIFTNFTASGNNQGIYLVASSNTFTNITASGNNYGIYMYDNSDSNTITSSRIENNSVAGVYLDDFFGFRSPEYNLFYNNIFNNTQNLLLDTGIPNPNYFNTTLDCLAGPNIIDGSCIGGNYWATPTGTGWSETCNDFVAPNGICDLGYEIDLSQYPWDWDNLTLT